MIEVDVFDKRLTVECFQMSLEIAFGELILHRDVRVVTKVW